MITLLFSSAGIMGWQFWKEIPLIACGIISLIQLMRLIQPHFIPNEKQLDKLDNVTDFYFDYCNKLERLWFDYENERITEEEAQLEFYKIKDSERDINKVVNEIVKSTNKTILRKCGREVKEYLSIFN
jgi:hypothetical protein